jgi:hypothetical protein
VLFLDLLAGFAGLAILGSSLVDLFKAVIMPRSVGGRFRASVQISRRGWRLWRTAAMRIGDAERREDTLAVFAPLFIVTLGAYWVASEIVGLGLVFWSLRWGINPTPGLGASIYFSGTSLLTIGYGDFSPVVPATRALSLFAGGIGLGTFAVVTTFLFQIFGAFQRREAFIVTMSERTGAPPSGLEFILRHVKHDMVADVGPLLREAQSWIAETMETHLAYPVLTYFRSSHDDESWVGTLGAILDAATLLITTAELDHRGEAEITARLGTHLVRDFAAYFRLPPSDAGGVDFDEFVLAYQSLGSLGVPLVPLENAWEAFSARRAVYTASLDAMAQWWRIPPARWIGDRSRIRQHVNAGLPR